MNKAIDSTMDYDISGPGGGSGAPENKLESTQRDVWDGKATEISGNKHGANNVPIVSKPESNDKVSSVFYDPAGDGHSPGNLESTMNSVLEINFKG
jgi:hypothetical protein